MIAIGCAPGEPAAVLDFDVACLPGGTAVMGTDAGESDEGPAHLVTVDPFCLGRYEVTNGQYRRFVEMTGARLPPHWEVADSFDDVVALPVVGVDWEEAVTYCDWVGGRLPTEAEWERACRGDSGRMYPWGAARDASHVDQSARIGFRCAFETRP